VFSSQFKNLYQEQHIQLHCIEVRQSKVHNSEVFCKCDTWLQLTNSTDQNSASADHLGATSGIKITYPSVRTSIRLTVPSVQNLEFDV